MAKRKKKITMVVTVSGPAEMTAAQARSNVRDLINHQCFTGSIVREDGWKITAIDQYNFRARSVQPPRLTNIGKL